MPDTSIERLFHHHVRHLSVVQRELDLMTSNEHFVDMAHLSPDHLDVCLCVCVFADGVPTVQQCFLF